MPGLWLPETPVAVGHRFPNESDLFAAILVLGNLINPLTTTYDVTPLDSESHGKISFNVDGTYFPYSTAQFSFLQSAGHRTSVLLGCRTRTTAAHHFVSCLQLRWIGDYFV